MMWQPMLPLEQYEFTLQLVKKSTMVWDIAPATHSFRLSYIKWMRVCGHKNWTWVINILCLLSRTTHIAFNTTARAERWKEAIWSLVCPRRSSEQLH